jgi:neutral ceramidase
MIYQQMSDFLKLTKCLLFSALCLSLATFSTLAYSADTPSPYLIGRGISDVTGPSYGIQMWGFGRADQLTKGIHIRQRSRAFVIAQASDPEKRIVFVSVDLGSIEHHVTLAVIDELQSRYGAAYGLNNVIISATHTHAGPGGYWHSRLDNGFDGGFYPQHFEAIVEGITDSVVDAHDDLQSGEIFIGTGELTNAGANRSMRAYVENPQSERDQYARNTPTQMTLLKFVAKTGDIGMLNWFALHPTAMNFYNPLISGDHKGYASLQMEQRLGNRYDGEKSFVAAFAQADPGDVTPNTNLNNTGPGETDVETTKIMGERQLEMATKLYKSAQEPLSGTIETRQVYVDLRNYKVSDQFTQADDQTTCPTAYGYSFAGGSTEDGGGHFLFREGMTEQNFILDLLIRWLTGAPKWTQRVKDCQKPKPILLETGSGEPPLQSQIRSVTVALVGQLAILALPAEITTMAGRRLRATVMNALSGRASHVVLAGYSNGYAGYITTPEEYMVQQYEGGHTLHGRWTLPAYQQIVSGLANSLVSGEAAKTNIPYDDWRGKSVETALYAGPRQTLTDDKALGDRFSERLDDKVEYGRGEAVQARFWSHDPTANFRTGNNFLKVQQKKQAGWKTVATDSDWSTTVRWQAKDQGMIATLTWHIDANVENGEYRLMHLGRGPQGNPFKGYSRTIQIK